MADQDALLEQQIEYYRARAPEYDEWFTRQGRYDRGAEHAARWEAEVEVVRRALHGAVHGSSVLELACGTGWWTSELARHQVSITAIDSSPEVLALNRRRVGSPAVRYVEADIFDWQPTAPFDTVFFSFWLTHVPPERFVAFWELIASGLSPGGRVFFVDSRWNPEYQWPLAAPDSTGVAPWVASRELNDGRRFDIVKIFYEPGELTALGWTARIRETERFFIWGEIERGGG